MQCLHWAERLPLLCLLYRIKLRACQCCDHSTSYTKIAPVSAVEHCKSVGGKAVPAVVADEIGVLQLQVEGYIAWQRLCVACRWRIL